MKQYGEAVVTEGRSPPHRRNASRSRMTAMTSEEVRSFLSSGTRTGKVATVRNDGSAHVAPVWFLLDGDTIVFTTGAETLKGRNLRRDPRTSMCVDDERPPYAFVVIRGTATLTHDGDEVLRWATRLGARYMGTERAHEFGRRNAVPGEMLVRITPARVIAERELAD